MLKGLGLLRKASPRPDRRGDEPGTGEDEGRIIEHASQNGEHEQIEEALEHAGPSLPSPEAVEGSPPMDIGQAVFLEQEALEGIRFLCRVENLEKDVILFSAPLNRGKVVDLGPAGSPVKVDYADRVARYNFETRLVEQVREPIPAVAMSRPEFHIRIQRRQHVRVDVSIPVRFGADLPGALLLERGTTRDLSAGGACILTGAILAPGARLRLRLEFQPEPVELAALVLRAVGDPAGSGGVTAFALSFQDVPPRLEDRLVHFVFHEEVRQKRMGLR
ncbi:MAG: PilZ domain-containing protein [Firmicutes bacterium]|nr:PilZ domain-containing protein [Bacillota bacterium]